MLRIRLTRMGAKKKPFYRVVVTEQRQARDGRFVEIVGHYNPGTNPPSVEMNLERVRYWMANSELPGQTGGSSSRQLTHCTSCPRSETLMRPNAPTRMRDPEGRRS